MTKLYLLTGSVVCFISLNMNAQTTIILQPGAAAGKDAFVDSYSPLANTNFGNSPDFTMLAWTVGGTPYIERSLIQFDLSSIPANSTIVTAYFSLYAVDSNDAIGQHSTLSGPNNAWIQRVTSAWNESTVTWNNQPFATTQNRVSLPASSSPSQNYIADVTQLTQDILTTGSNFGFMFLLDDESYYRRLNFHSSDYTVANKRPKLVVTYCSPPPASITLSGPANICPGDSAILTANSGAGLTYQWKKNDTYITGATAISYAATTTGLYSVEVTNSSGCTGFSSGITITVGNQFTIALRPNSSTGKDATVDSYSNLSNLNFGSDINLYAQAWTQQGTLYIIRSFIEFNLSSIPPNSTILSASLSLYGAGDHSTLSGPNNGWIQRVTQAWDESTITWNNQPPVTTLHKVSLPASINAWQDYTNIDVTAITQDMISVPGNNFGFRIKLDNENYYRQLHFYSSDYADSLKRPQLVISYEVRDTAIITPAGPTTFCSGSSVKLNANSGAGYTYQWKKDGAPISGANNSYYYASATAGYSVEVTTLCSMVTSLPVNVTVNALPSATITAAGPTTFCDGGSIMLNAPFAANRAYQWKNGNSDISGATSSSYSASTGGNYKVTVTNTNTGCVKTTANPTVVMVKPVPNATVTPQGPTTFCAGDSVILQANTATGLTYKWKKGGNYISGATMSSYTATTGGVYKTEVTKSNGCSKTSAGVTVTVPCRDGESEKVSEWESEMVVYPNPSAGVFTIKFLTKPISSVQIEMLDAIGNVVEKLETSEATVTLNKSNLANGIYCLTARNKDRVVVKKINIVN